VLQQLKLHFGFGGESLTCARAFSSAVATPCSDSEAGAAPAAKRREHRDQAIQIKVDREGPQSGTGRRGTADDAQEHIPRGAQGAATASARARESESRRSTATRRRTPPPPLPCLRCCRCCAITLPAWDSGAGRLPCSSPALSISLLEP
jgi:hypothetical protein